MQRPIIAINCDVSLERGGTGEVVSLRLAYIEAIEKAGGLPFIVPPLRDRADIPSLMARVRGLVLVGGDDVDPALYGRPQHEETRPMSGRRQDSDLVLIRAALDARLPLLAICAGHQELNVLLGGTLHQHVPERFGHRIIHTRADELARQGREQFHLVVIEENSLLGQITGTSEFTVNSSHHQAVDRLGRGLRPVAVSADGLVEAMELLDPNPARFLLSVQWHPERLTDRPEHLALFAALVNAA